VADLSGKPRGLQVAERKFLELDVDTFSSRLKATKPRVTFNLPNTLTEEGNLNAKPKFDGLMRRQTKNLPSAPPNGSLSKGRRPFSENL
jgi:predicted component of type VI protein secretion system